MGILSTIGSWFAPASKIVDELHTSTEEKMILKNELANIQALANEKLLELEIAAINARKEVAIAEAQSSNWLTASWRPIASIYMIIVLSLDAFGYANVTDSFWTLATNFLVGYAGGRTIEKVAKVIKLGK